MVSSVISLKVRLGNLFLIIDAKNTALDKRLHGAFWTCRNFCAKGCFSKPKKAYGELWSLDSASAIAYANVIRF